MLCMVLCPMLATFHIVLMDVAKNSNGNEHITSVTTLKVSLTALYACPSSVPRPIAVFGLEIKGHIV